MTDRRADRLAEFIEPLRVRPGSKVDLARDFDPGYKAGFLRKKDGAELLRAGVELLADYQARLAARTLTGCWCACRRWAPAASSLQTVLADIAGLLPPGW